MRRCRVPLSRILRVCVVVCGLAGLDAAFGAPARSDVPPPTRGHGGDVRESDNWEQTTARLETTRAMGGVSDGDDWIG
jgi:hypothetical protein